MYSAKKIVLDFDGTIFRVFTNYDLKKVARKIYGLLSDYQTTFRTDSDAFDAFGSIMNADLPAAKKRQLLRQVDEWLIEAEMEALDSGILIDGFWEFVEAAKKKKIDIAIVSNNSAACIKEFLYRSNTEYTIPVLGRIGVHPERMKPDSYMMEEMSRILKCSNDEIIYVGDNHRDYECALRFRCQFIGMTPTPAKKERLHKKAPNITTVDDFFELMQMLWG